MDDGVVVVEWCGVVSVWLAFVVGGVSEVRPV